MNKLTKRTAKWMASVAANFAVASRKPIEEWVKLAKRAGVAGDRKRARQWLRVDQGLTTVQTSFVLHALCPEPEVDDDALVQQQFAGAKAGLRPIYDALARLACSFGTDVMIAPRKTQITFARDVTFAVVRAATKTRVDLALRLPGEQPTRRLVASAQASGSDPTHVVALESATAIDAVVKSALRRAYAQASRRKPS
jgi:hypothetical protein